MPDELLQRPFARYEELSPEATNLAAWPELGREAALPVQVTPEALRRTKRRAIVLRLERLMGYPMVRRRVESGQLALHGWHYASWKTARCTSSM